MAKKQFKAESQRLLDLMINSIYTHKEIFLREIISNASDAVDKLCYIALSDGNVGLGREDFAITITPDKEARTLTISDNGIGMTEEELESNLGVIARSGSLKFKQEHGKQEGDEGEKDGDIDIIGQFGVGFYSAFMVSDTVEVITKAYGSDKAYRWDSTGSDGYSITECEKDSIGTDIIMHIKEDSEDESYSEFLEYYRLSALIKKYSDYIRYPIKMDREMTRPLPKPDDAPEDYVAETETYTETQTLNSMVPVWQRNRNELKDEDYNRFYQEKFYDFEEPLCHVHIDAEGAVSYKALLYIPAKAAYDYYTKEYKKGLQLYSSGVLIMDRCEELVPEHFRFVRGVVDSPDLSLNISRELLQHDRQLKTIATNLERRIKNELAKLLEQKREAYEGFWKHFGVQLKYGAIADYGAHKEQLQDLLLFSSSAGDKPTTLAEYIERMPEEQKYIYFATGESIQKIASLPQAEQVRTKGFEILYFTEEVDEFVAQILRSYKEKDFRSINSDDLGFESEDDKKAIEEKQEESKDLLDFISEALGDKVKEVRLTGKLVSAPVCLSAAGPVSFEMERYLQQVQPDNAPKADRVLELNAEHEVFAKLVSLKAGNPEKAKAYAEILFYQSALTAGLDIEDPAAYSSLIYDLMK